MNRKGFLLCIANAAKFLLPYSRCYPRIQLQKSLKKLLFNFFVLLHSVTFYIRQRAPILRNSQLIFNMYLILRVYQLPWNLKFYINIGLYSPQTIVWQICLHDKTSVTVFAYQSLPGGLCSKGTASSLFFTKLYVPLCCSLVKSP